jgi:hypothetical protein
MCLAKMYYGVQIVLPLSACFLNMCFVLTCAFYLRIKLCWCDWKQCTQSSHSRRHSLKTASQRSSQHTAVVGQIITECHRAGPFSEVWFRDLQLLESGSARIHRTVAREPKVSIWLYVVLICSERSLWERSHWLTCQIFRRKINIREEICSCITAYLNRICQNSTYLNSSANKNVAKLV